MIYGNYTIAVKNEESVLDKDIILYRGDREVELYFTIKESPFLFRGSGENIIEKTNASYAQIIIKVPGDRLPIFGEITATSEGKVILKITSDMIDEIEEVGEYDFQIRLYDENKTSRATIPPVLKRLKIKEPIAIEDASINNEVGIAVAGYAEIGTKAMQRPTLNEDGNYNKKTWVDSEVITKEDLNVLEDIADKNTNEGHTHSNKATLDEIAEEKITSWDNKLDSIPEEYVTEEELNSKGYLTQHQDISMKVDKVDGKSLIADTEITRLSTVTNYTLPIATASTLGGIKVGAGLSITAGVLSATGGGVADSVEWKNVQNKPSVFIPATHTHSKSDITDFSHTHTINDLPTGTTSTTVSLGNHVHTGVYEPVISTKNTAFNVNFDTIATNIKMNGTQSVGTLGTVARADHVHPTDTSRVATTITVNNKPLSSNITLTLDDIANGSTRSLDNYSLSTHNHDTNYAPLSHTSDTVSHITSDERSTWNSKTSLALGTTSSTAFRGDYGDTAYTHSQSAHAPSTAQKNSDITKAEIEAKLTGVINSHSHENSGVVASDNLVTTNIVGITLTLTTDKYQSTTMTTGTTIVLPTVTSFAEIHLFFSASSDMTLTLPSCKWQTTPSIKSGKYYEFIFTYTTEWIGGCIQYG